MEALWDRIQSILSERGWSQRELARKAELESETHVGLLRTTKGPQGRTLAKIAAAADVELAWLTDGTGPRRRSGRAPSACVGLAALETVLSEWSWNEELRIEDVDAIVGALRAEAVDAPSRPVSVWRFRVGQLERIAASPTRELDASIESALDRRPAPAEPKPSVTKRRPPS